MPRPQLFAALLCWMATLIMRVAADARVVCRGYLPNVTNCSAADDDAHSGVVLANFSGTW